MKAPCFRAEEVEAFRQSLLLGTERQPAPLPEAARRLIPDGTPGEKALLGTLALVAQYDRLTRTFPVVPLPPPRDVTGDDLVPEAARPTVRAALLTSAQGSPLVRATLAHLKAAGKRLHPFDLPALERAARAHPELLHEADRRALRLAPTNKPPSDPFDLGPKDLVAYFQDLRRTAPGEARARLEPAFATLKAPVRAQLVRVLARHLSEADRSFLESLETDKSRTVRQEVETLLSTLPSTAAHSRRLERLGEDLILQPGRIVRKEVSFARGVKPAEVTARAFGLGLLDLLGVLGLDRAAFLRSPPILPGPLEAVFLVGAMRDDDREAIDRIVGLTSVDWLEVLEAKGPALSPDPLVRHLPRARILSRTDRLPALAGALLERFGAPLPEALARPLAKAAGAPQIAGPLAVLMPEEVLLEVGASLPPDHPFHRDPWFELIRQVPRPNPSARLLEPKT